MARPAAGTGRDGDVGWGRCIMPRGSDSGGARPGASAKICSLAWIKNALGSTRSLLALILFFFFLLHHTSIDMRH